MRTFLEGFLCCSACTLPTTVRLGKLRVESQDKKALFAQISKIFVSYGFCFHWAGAFIIIQDGIFNAVNGKIPPLRNLPPFLCARVNLSGAGPPQIRAEPGQRSCAVAQARVNRTNTTDRTDRTNTTDTGFAFMARRSICAGRGCLVHSPHHGARLPGLPQRGGFSGKNTPAGLAGLLRGTFVFRRMK